MLTQIPHLRSRDGNGMLLEEFNQINNLDNVTSDPHEGT